ncbi:MAG: ATP-binding cassette domain-containing protein [Bacteroidaceae bacterium]|nr:ATP-binding cassette domain-containing protein [Bacteroidaceae bacterium]
MRGKILHAIRDVSLELYEGETLAIVGESGSGKSVFTKSFIGMLDKNGWVESGSMVMDGVDFSQFGSYMLKGSDDSIRKAANIREALKIDVKSVSGISYDDEEVHFKSKDVTLKLLIDADNITEFWRRYNSLFAILMQSESRILYFANLPAEYDCYYKNMSVSKFEILKGGRIWCEFSVVLVFTAYRPESSWMLLATEDFDWVVTEDESQARIKIRPKYGISLLVTEDGKYIITESDSDKIYINNQK